MIAQHVDPRQSPGSYHAMVGGLHTSPALITHDGSQSGVQVALSPLGARALLGVPAGALAGLDLDAADLFGSVAGEIRERLLAAAGWGRRFDVLDRMLLARLGACLVPAAEVGHAWRRLLRSGGAVPIAALADEVGWSARHLTDRFAAEFGLTPKATARVVRFDLARRALAGPGTIAAVAATHGYYDQSHLVREFHALAGCSPSAWLAEEFGNIQARAQAELPPSGP
ncbi:helix-turn-helix transcriptional regulator [Solihabitans fulvus]|uniref:helix-turn-helix transcriptional regulator n=1 Tax=Solihabitans fulvus TaxID=1892852 RepID=UPI001CB76451|nr:helix-turn-helix transcriptional regulator [Solihabitans fulvus]